MNKLLKLPLFLGICGAACGGILAGVYSITAPIVEETNNAKAAEAYASMYQKLDSTITSKSGDIRVIEKKDLPDSLYSICTSKAEVIKVKGAAYTCSFQGFGGVVNFQIGFANGKFLSFNSISHQETQQGKTAMEKLPDLIVPTLSINTDLMDLPVVSASSVTGHPIAEIVDICRTDYLSWYETL